MQTRGVAIPTATGYQVMEGKGALVNRNSVFFTFGRGISLIGDGFYFSTLIVWITFLTLADAHTPAQQAAAFAKVAIIQAAIFGVAYLANFLVIPFVGVFVDRWNRRTTMIISDFAQAFLALLPLGAFFVARDAFLPTIYVSYFLLIAAQGFFGGSQSGVLQVIVARKNLPQVISILNVLLGIGGVLGALGAPFFFLAVGPLIAIVVNAASFLVSATALLFLRVPKEALHPYAYRQTDASVDVSSSIRRVFKDLRHSVRFVFATRILLGIAIMVVFANAGAAAINSVATGFFFANMHADPVQGVKLLGLLPAGFGVGSITGALLVGIFAKFIKLKGLALAGILGAGLGLLVMASQTTVLSGVLSFALTGIFTGAFNVSYSALVLKVTPNSIIGRVVGVLVALATFSAFITAFAVSILVQVDNPATNPHTPFPNPAVLFTDIFIIAGILVIVASFVGFAFVRKAKEEAAGTESVLATPAIAMAGAPGTLAAEEGLV